VGGSSNSISDQVQNPVSSQPVDNNGVILELPTISTVGTASVSGYMVLGIGTQSNNTPGTAKKYAADTDGYYTTSFNGSNYDSFVDSGSNGLFFEGPGSLPSCSGGSAWFCPGSILTFSAITKSADNTVASTINFQVGNANSLFSSGNKAFSDLGGGASGMFDFGLPFYFGRNVILGIDGRSSSLGTGPYWAY
jgi:hypothetical protein